MPSAICCNVDCNVGVVKLQGEWNGHGAPHLLFGLVRKHILAACLTGAAADCTPLDAILTGNAVRSANTTAPLARPFDCHPKAAQQEICCCTGSCPVWIDASQGTRQLPAIR